MTSILTGAATAFINWTIAKISTPSGLAVTLEGVDIVDALAVLARVVVAVIDVDFTPAAGESGYAIAQEGGEGIPAAASVEARIFPAAIVFVHVAVLSGKSDGAGAAVAVDQVCADAAVEAGA